MNASAHPTPSKRRTRASKKASEVSSPVSAIFDEPVLLTILAGLSRSRPKSAATVARENEGLGLDGHQMTKYLKFLTDRGLARILVKGGVTAKANSATVSTAKGGWVRVRNTGDSALAADSLRPSSIIVAELERVGAFSVRVRERHGHIRLRTANDCYAIVHDDRLLQLLAHLSDDAGERVCRRALAAYRTNETAGCYLP